MVSESALIWIAYAVHEGAMGALGRAVMAVLAANAPTPDGLPDVIKQAHAVRTLVLANEISGSASASSLLSKR